jgi:hypothetical protein
MPAAGSAQTSPANDKVESKPAAPVADAPVQEHKWADDGFDDDFFADLR